MGMNLQPPPSKPTHTHTAPWEQIQCFQNIPLPTTQNYVTYSDKIPDQFHFLQQETNNNEPCIKSQLLHHQIWPEKKILYFDFFSFFLYFLYFFTCLFAFDSNVLGLPEYFTNNCDKENLNPGASCPDGKINCCTRSRTSHKQTAAFSNMIFSGTHRVNTLRESRVSTLITKPQHTGFSSILCLYMENHSSGFY